MFRGYQLRLVIESLVAIWFIERQLESLNVMFPILHEPGMTHLYVHNSHAEQSSLKAHPHSEGLLSVVKHLHKTCSGFRAVCSSLNV
jgi:hypothetical protein